jgi:hypothetical protein
MEKTVTYKIHEDIKDPGNEGFGVLTAVVMKNFIF